VSGLEKTAIKFGTSGWRGIISDDFTSENLAIVAQAIANCLKKQGSTKAGVIAGYDTRFMSDRFARICANVLKNNNIPVLLTDRDTPTPVIAYSIINNKAIGGINITASHNPPQYNGIKYSTSYGGPAPEEVTGEIERETSNIQQNNLSVPYLTSIEGLETFDPKPVYIKHISKKIDLSLIKKSKIKAAIDCLHGTLHGYLDYILEKNGIKITVLHNTINPGFEGGSPDPSKEERLADLKRTVTKTKSHLGLATDGDSDRFGIVDRDGAYIPANYMLPLILEHLLKTRKHSGGIVRSITTTRMLDAVAKKFGRGVYEVPVGFKYVGSGLMEHNAIMGCEESSGMTIFDHVPEKDGILACLLVCEMVALNKKSLKQLLKEAQKQYGSFYSKRIDINLKPEDRESVINRVKQKRPNEMSGIKISNYEVLPGDNIKIEFVDGSWIMVRPSGTEPVVRCYCETTSLKKLPALEKDLRELVV
jgi:alpha-D-glucose phosphate-specific phosphoglucomutase